MEQSGNCCCQIALALNKRVVTAGPPRWGSYFVVVGRMEESGRKQVLSRLTAALFFYLKVRTEPSDNVLGCIAVSLP